MPKVLQKLKRHLLLKLSSILCPQEKPKVVHSRVNGYDLLVFANEDVGRSIHFCGTHETPETNYFAKSVAPNSICVDIGANVGYFTILMAKIAHAGSVHAFEPISLNAALLRASMEINSLTNIVVNECAVGDRTGSASFVRCFDSAYSSFHDTGRRHSNGTITVRMVTLDDYIQSSGVSRVDILKADVEGAEGLVVAGASQLLSDRERRPRLVLLELFENNLRAFGSSVRKIVEDMERRDYVPYVLSDDGHLVRFHEN